MRVNRSGPYVVVLVVLFLLALTSCGKELTAGGRQRVDVVVTDDEPAAGPGPAATSPDERFDPTNAIIPAAGQVEVTLSVALRHATGEIVQMTPQPVSASLAIGGGESVTLGSASVRTGRYSEIILTFESAAAVVELGPLAGLVEVAIGQQPLLVEKEIDLEVGDLHIETVEVNLNTLTWTAFAVGGFVSPTQFANALQVQVR
jgi:hypothetical protein